MERSVPITPFTESVRRMVVKTSCIPGLRRMYAGVYRAAVRALVREVASSPCTLCIFSRNSYAAGTFVPGQSDIDLTIVVRDDLPPSVVRTYLRDMYLLCERLRRRFPMLDQFPVYTRRGFIAAYRLGPLRLETDAWQCEWGDDDELRELLEPPAHAQRPLDAVTRGAQIYLNGFHSNLRAALGVGQAHSTLAMERSARKIERALGSRAPGGHGADLGKAGRIPEVVARVLTATTGAVEGRAPGLRPHRWKVLSREANDPNGVEIHPEPAPDGITGILTRRSGGGSFYVLSTPVSAGAVDGAMAHSQNSGNSGSSPVVFTTVPLLTFFLRHVNPLLYYRLKVVRSVRGVDVLAHMPPPSEEGVRRFFRFETAHLLRLSTRLGSDERHVDKRAERYERRRVCLFHFLRYGEILLDSNLSPDAPLEPRRPRDGDLLDAVLDGMPGVLGALSEHSDRLAARLEPGEAKAGGFAP